MMSIPAALLSATTALAEGVGSDARRDGASSPGAEDLVVNGAYYRLFGGMAVGRGLRFNNPYRLETELGGTAESLSLTATYIDGWAGVVSGLPDDLQHGGVLHASVATDGVDQEVITPSYIALYALGRRWIIGGRAGFPIVIEPDANVGGEIAALGTFLVTAGIGVSAELIGSLFYGAATLESSRSAIPILSFQLGASVDYEVLP